MTSNRQTANRGNARRSTGPRTQAGKSRSSTNARRHGLSIPIHADLILDARAKALARAIAGDGASPEWMEIARRIAEATVDLARIRQSRLRVLASIVADVNRDDAANDDGTSEFDDQAMPEGLAKRLAKAAGELRRLDRYERRALSRRKTAGRRLQAIGIYS